MFGFSIIFRYWSAKVYVLNGKVRVHIKDLVDVTIQTGRRPMATIEAAALGIVERSMAGWMTVCLRWCMRLLVGEEAAEGWTLETNPGGTVRWKLVRYDLAADLQGLEFGWEDMHGWVCRAKARVLSHCPGEPGFEAEQKEEFAKLLDEHLLDVQACGSAVETIQIGSPRSRMSLSLHRKDLAVRRRRKMNPKDSFYAELMWSHSRGYSPEAPTWRAEFRFDAEGLNLAFLEKASNARGSQIEVTPYDLVWLSSAEGRATLWEYATRNIRLRPVGRDGLQGAADRVDLVVAGLLP